MIEIEVRTLGAMIWREPVRRFLPQEDARPSAKLGGDGAVAHDVPARLIAATKGASGAIIISPDQPSLQRVMLKVFGPGEIRADEKGQILYFPIATTDEPFLVMVDEKGSPSPVRLRLQ